jgi:multisubunit Na+/H+ antiporter MnhE subunit
MYYSRAIVLLALAYLALTANLELSNIIVGLLLATAIILLLRPERRPVNLKRTIPAAIAFGRYLLILIYDLLVSGIQVARIVLDPALPIKPGVVAIPSGCESELGTALSAHAVSLTPGELVVEIDERGVMYTHCLNATGAEQYIAAAQKLRRDMLEKIFT